jgi:putative ABC transport system permease protein
MLGIGIGVNTAVFSALHAVLLRPLPYANADRAVMIWQEFVGRGGGLAELSYPNFTDLRSQARSFEHLVAFSTQEFTVQRNGLPERLTGVRVSSGLFPALQLLPARGRSFVPEEEQVGGSRAVLISHRLWQTRFASDPSLPGGSIALNGQSHTVVGIMGPGFRFPPPFATSVNDVGLAMAEADLWIPLSSDEFPDRRERRIFMAIGVLRGGVSVQQAQSDVDVVARRLADAFPGPNDALGFRVIPLQEHVVGEVREALLILLGAVGFVTLIACANVANLLLARAAARRKEMAVRAALGASRRRLLRQLLAESVCLALLGGVAGGLFARLAVDLFVAFGPAGFPRLDEIAVYWQALTFNLALALLTGIVAGLVPAWHGSRLQPSAVLKDESSSTAGRTRRPAHGLVVAELALCVILSAAAGLMVNSLLRLTAVDPGFRTDGLLVLDLFVPPEAAREEERRVELHRGLLEALRSLPDVQAVATVSLPPFSRGSGASVSVTPEGRASSPDQPLQVTERPVSAGYFRAMGIPLRSGRAFDERDALSATSVAIVNETLARRLVRDGEIIGSRLRVEGQDRLVTVIGVVADVRQFGLDLAPVPEVYLPYLQNPGRGVTVLIRTNGNPMRVAGPVRAAIGRVHPALPVSNSRTMDAAVADSLAGLRLNAALLVLFAVVALVLASAGVYGVVSHAIVQRTREIAVRIALGAQPRDVLQLVLAQQVRLIAAGIAIGLVGSLMLTRFMAALLYGVSPADPLTLSIVAIALTAAALVAAAVPSRRATLVPPAGVLRSD